jgi:hypothetical protein
MKVSFLATVSLNIFKKVIMHGGKKKDMNRAKQTYSVDFNRKGVDKLFLAICQEILSENGRINSQQGFAYLSRRLADHFPVEASSIDVHKIYFKFLKLWKVWKRLIKNSEGIHIDFITGVIVAGENWWTRKLKVSFLFKEVILLVVH